MPQFTRRPHAACDRKRNSPDGGERTPATTENDAPPNLSMLGTRCGGLLQTKGLRAFQIDVGQRFVAHGLSSLKPLLWGTAALEQPCDTGKQQLSPSLVGSLKLAIFVLRKFKIEVQQIICFFIGSNP